MPHEPDHEDVNTPTELREAGGDTGTVGGSLTDTEQAFLRALRSVGGGGDDGGGGAPANPLVVAGQRLYFSLWGEPAPPGYIEGLVRAGMNLREIELNEVSKPAFQNTGVYEDEYTSFFAGLLRFLGVRV